MALAVAGIPGYARKRERRRERGKEEMILEGVILTKEEAGDSAQ